MPYIPREAVLDWLGQKIPKLGLDGPYYQMSQATKIGLQEIKQQQIKQKEETKTLDKVKQKFKNEALKEMFGGNNSGNNGNRKEQLSTAETQAS